MTVSEESLAQKQLEAKKVVAEWLDIDNRFSSEDTFFGYMDLWIGGGLLVARPVYFMFAKKSIFVDFPFCQVEEAGDLVTELGPWGLGKVHSALTYHNVFAYGPLLADPGGTLHLLRMIGSMAAGREFSILGEHKFLKELPHSNQTPDASAGLTVAKNQSMNPEIAGGQD